MNPASGGGLPRHESPREGLAFAAGLEDVVLRGLAGEKAAGLVIRAERGGRLLFQGAWGWAVDLPGRRVAMSPETKFDLASVTKLFTTTAALRLATLGLLDLDAELAELEPTRTMAVGRPLIARAFRDISVRSLMTHSSGLHYWYPLYASGAAAAREGGRLAAGGRAAPSTGFGTLGSALEEVLGRFPPKPGVVYSDINYILLGALVEAASGLALDQAVQELVARPLGLGSTAYRPAGGPFAATEFGNRIEEGMVADLGLSFDGWRGRGEAFEGEPDDGNCHYFFDGVAGHAGLFSTVRDACALGRAFLWPGEPAGGASQGPAAAGGWSGPYLAPALAEEAARDHGGGRGLGFQLGELYPEGGFGHTGFTGTYLYLNARLGLSVAVFANRLHVENPVSINELRKEIAVGAVAACSSSKTGAETRA